MKERENELTNKANYPNLEGKGINMPDGPNSPENQPQQVQGEQSEHQTEQDRTQRDIDRAAKEFAKPIDQSNEAINKLSPGRRAALERAAQRIPGLDEEAKIKFLGDAAMGAEILGLGDEQKIGVPENLEDLAKLMIKMSDETVWGEKGTKPLTYIDKETGLERVNAANFLDWYRTNMFRVHNFNPTSSVNFFSDLGMSVRNDQWGSMISFYEIVFQESLFLDKKPNDKTGEEERVVNKDYQALRDQLLMEVFLFSLMRNGDITYRTNRGSQKEMMDSLAQAYTVNPLTRSNFFEFIMTMPSMQRKSIRDVEVEQSGKDEIIQGKREANFYMGNAVREALAAYINIFDYDQLKKILGTDGKDPVLFKRDYQEMDSETGKQKINADGNLAIKTIEHDVKEEKEGFREEDKRVNQWFNPDGSVKLYKFDQKEKKWNPSTDGTGRPHEHFMDYINVFLSPNPDQRQQAEVRERIVLSIMEKNKISYNEAKLAEAWAYSMTYMFGVGARNDTQSIAFDWWTRLTNFQDYRKRQKAERRGALYGGEHNMEGLKRIGLTFFEAARDIRERSIQEIIQGGKVEEGKKDINIENDMLKNTVDLERDEHGNIVFYDETGQKIEGLSAKKAEVVEDTIQTEEEAKSIARIKYLDASGNEVNVGNAKTKTKIERVATPVEFKADLQKQFMPNHMYTAAGVYEHILKQVQMNFPDMVKGYDTHGNPILDQEKIDKLKAGVEHDVRYSLSTWPEINFTDKFVMWERKEVRNERGRLLARHVKDVHGNPMELDEKWNVIGTSDMDEPITYLDSRPMTILESMFGVDALKYIQFEIEKRKLNHGTKVEEITGTSFGGKQETVRVDLSGAKEEQFKIAIWRGAFDYLVASEIAAHRDRGSGFEWYDGEKMAKTVDALRDGRFVSPDQIGKIQKETRTKLKWLFTQDLAYIFSTGGMEGFWKIFKIMFGDILKDAAK